MSPSDIRLLKELYEVALRLRIVDETLASIYHLQEMRSPTHFGLGQEAIAAGVCQALKKQDSLYSTYRSHGWYLAKGGNLERMVCELYGRSTGCSSGWGGSMHLIDLQAGFEGTTALVGGAIPHAVGAAFSFVYQKKDAIAVSVFGDAATEEGIFQESVMFAALRKLPIVFICENNGLAVNTPIHLRQPNVPIHRRVEVLGIPSLLVDGNDAFAVYNAARQAVARAREGGGPTFVECTTWRPIEHCGPDEDFHLGYRSAEEVEKWKSRDPILLLESRLGADLPGSLKAKYKEEISSAIELARKTPFEGSTACR